MKVLKWIGSAVVLIIFALIIMWCNGYFTCVSDGPGTNSCTYGTGGS